MINLFSRQVHWQGSVLLLPIIYFIHRSYRMYLDRLGDEKRHVEEMAGLHLRTIEALALAIEAKDHTTHEHLRRVRVYAVEIGKDMGLSAPDLEALRAAALLHDIGKAGDSRAHHLQAGALDSRRIRENEDPSRGGRRNTGTRLVPLPRGAAGARASRAMGRLRLSGRAEG